MSVNSLDAYRDPEPEGGRRRRGGRGGKRRRPTDWLNGREGRGERALVPDVEFQSYYGRGVIKPVPWEWPIPTYLFFGGLAGGSQLLATGAYLTGNEPLQRVTRLTTAVAVAVSGASLIGDLGRPERFYNMMRVAKLSSPMSVGTWILSGFSGGAMPLAALEVLRMLPLKRSGTVTGLVGALDRVAGAAGEVASASSLEVPGSRWLRRQSRAAGRRDAGLRVNGALVGVEKMLGVTEPGFVALGASMAAPLATYTAVLLSNTSTPTWHESRLYLPFVFGGSASAAASGNAMMWTPVEKAGPARALALIGPAVDLGALNRLEKHLDAEGVGEPLHHGTAGKLNKASMALNVAGFVGTALFARRSRVASVVSGACFVAGSVCTRFAVFEAGMESAKDPKYTMGPQRRRLDARGGTENITTGPRLASADDAPRTADGRRPLPGPDGKPVNL